jgi:phosphatidylcholine synthase
MKTVENYFCGFPAVWNLIVFYLLLLRPPAAMCAAVIVVFAALTFVPIRFVHPIRVRRWRALTVALLVLWSLLALLAVLQDLSPGSLATVTLCLIAIYFAVIGLIPARRNPI